MTLPNVLVVDDKPNMRSLLEKVLGKFARVIEAGDVRAALRVLAQEEVAVVVCDLRMPDGEGLEVLQSVRARSPGTPFILMTAYATVGTAVQAMREGAYDYITKPFDPDEMAAIVRRALAQSTILANVAAPQEAPDGFGPLLGRSQKMRELFRYVERIAATDATVLLLGETGTGKELVARAIHEHSERKQKSLVAVNCAAIARSLLESELFGHARGSFTGAAGDRPGLFEAADKSTLLLDEIGELRPSIQAKLTRVLEERAIKRIGESRERKIDVRLIAATHRDLRTMVRTGSFREDLWFRLNVCVIDIPPLRERVDDIPLLANHFLAERAPLVKSPARGFTLEAMSALTNYTWPGNVRELRSAIERAAIAETGHAISYDALPLEIRGAPKGSPASQLDVASMTLKEALDAAWEEANRRYITAALRRFRGDVSAAAVHAGVERESFYRVMRRYGLVADEFRAAEIDADAKDPPKSSQ